MAADQDRHHVAIQIEAMLKIAQPPSENRCCIYRVPPSIRKLNPDAYTPKIVSIGPFHRKNKKLLSMEGQKHIYCKRFIDRARSEASLDDLVSCVLKLEPQVRSCYSEDIKLSRDEFVKVIFVDCCFILELVLRHFFPPPTQNDDISIKPWLMTNVAWDLLLLENQIPFFVFKKLYHLAFASRLNAGIHPSFMWVATLYFSFGTDKPVELPPNVSVAHFTDLYRTCRLQPSNILPGRGNEPLSHLYSATELNEAGVKFRVNKESKGFLDMQFSGCHLRIPQLIVEDYTEIMLRNIMAFEQCHYPEEPYITDYVELIDFLINTEKDVDLLVRKGIIVNWLGESNAVAKLFNGLCKNIVAANSNIDYLRICKELNDYYKHPWHSRVATLRRDYCNTPWKMAASIAGIALLILTVIQTGCSIRQVV